MEKENTTFIIGEGSNLKVENTVGAIGTTGNGKLSRDAVNKSLGVK